MNGCEKIVKSKMNKCKNELNKKNISATDKVYTSKFSSVG